MIPYIDSRLQEWAKWSLSGPYGGGGTILQRMIDARGVLIKSTAMYDPHGHEEEMLTDKAVASLIPELRRTVEAAYKGRGGITAKLSELRCSKATYFRRLDHAHIRIMDFINAYDPSEDVKKRLTLVRPNDSICVK